MTSHGATLTMRLIIGCVGRLKRGSQSDLFRHYLDRVCSVGKAAGFTKVDLLEVPESSGISGLRSKIPDGAKVFLFDERGRTLSSRSFTDILQGFMLEGVDCWCGIIGGFDGIDSSWRESADDVISFGSWTLPHQLVRILVAEQLYRSATILTGHPYHRD